MSKQGWSFHDKDKLIAMGRQRPADCERKLDAAEPQHARHAARLGRETDRNRHQTAAQEF
ncbi:hypothetical protein [Mesorhizobium sp. B2-1-8]|uniref:hypothetical protein n=1 Tax=Mesorhizobium sp. B2-1-8 TaxID=2589967 RepID=UPI0039EFB4B1